jgi:hypothetical protein
MAVPPFGGRLLAQMPVSPGLLRRAKLQPMPARPVRARIAAGIPWRRLIGFLGLFNGIQWQQLGKRQSIWQASGVPELKPSRLPSFGFGTICVQERLTHTMPPLAGGPIPA